MITKLNTQAIQSESITYDKLAKDSVKAEFIRMSVDRTLRFFCIEPVSVTIGESIYEYTANSNVELLVGSDETFSITTTSDNSIMTLSGWPGALSTFYSWLEGVSVFSGIVFDMNTEEMYMH